MSDFVATFDALRTRLQAFTALPLYWPNDERTPSLGSTVAPAGYVYSEISIQDSRQITLGNPVIWRDFGELAVYVNVPRATRVGVAEQHAETIRGLFGVNSVSGVIVTKKTIGLGKVVESTNGRLWSVPVLIDWFADREESVS